MERGENGAVSTMQALLRWRRSAHTLHSFPAPSTCFLGTISNFAFQRLPLLSAGIMVPFSSHFLICCCTTSNGCYFHNVTVKSYITIVAKLFEKIESTKTPGAESSQFKFVLNPLIQDQITIQDNTHKKDATVFERIVI